MVRCDPKASKLPFRSDTLGASYNDVTVDGWDWDNTLRVSSQVGVLKDIIMVTFIVPQVSLTPDLRIPMCMITHA